MIKCQIYDEKYSTVHYLKLGADAKSRAIHERFVEAYDRRKNTEAIGAIVLREPIISIS